MLLSLSSLISTACILLPLAVTLWPDPPGGSVIWYGFLPCGWNSDRPTLWIPFMVRELIYAAIVAGTLSAGAWMHSYIKRGLLDRSLPSPALRTVAEILMFVEGIVHGVCMGVCAISGIFMGFVRIAVPCFLALGAPGYEEPTGPGVGSRYLGRVILTGLFLFASWLMSKGVERTDDEERAIARGEWYLD